MRHFGSLASVLIGASFLAACSSTPIAPETQAPAQPVTPPTAVTPAKPTDTAKSVVAPVVVAAYLDPQNAIFRERSVYFDFDQFTLKPEGTRVAELHGKYLSANPGVSIRIEGNTDELGGREYNLALGQKRAEAVRRAMALSGLADAQIEAVSFGKEKPAAIGGDETSMAKNRRAEISYR